METEGMNLRGSSSTSERMRKWMFAAALTSVAVAGVALGFVCGSSGRGEQDFVARGAADTRTGAGSAAGFAPAPADGTGSAQSADAPQAPPAPDAPQAPPAPDAPVEDEPADVDLTATPTEEPTATPTATPDGDPCPFCPEDVDDLVIPATTPVDPCVFCIDPVIQADPAPLAFEHREAEYCGSKTVMSATLNRVAWIWVEYTNMDGEHETAKLWNDNLYLEVDADWGWFGEWGWIYAVNITFHAMDEDGVHISEWTNPHYC